MKQLPPQSSKPCTMSPKAAGCESSPTRDGFVTNSQQVSRVPEQPAYYSICELADRWRVSRGTVYNRLRAVGAPALDFSAQGKRSKKAIKATVVLEIEARKTRRIC